ncbi:YdcH family protein [Pseudohoeflea coraliihabitans]|uniref:DUF465 domain-containing protein n=1 Tax=Pseudohoeflea coraliihabitans TaxID=2860393 RepID=A0ABS6WQE1_9HYPH|nr:DUF465 domain-containing protein [Pseudohoeflea sp. DP4N28-3]MBW3097863.1 DUF465 domain-containing protein [Pseudohoeflea sp. DP4N28-3]
MSIEAHLETLEEKHGQLDEKLRSELSSPSAADTTIVALKRDKLRIKDEIVRLKSGTTQH